MGNRYLTDLADVCRGAGLVVQEEPNWQTRARGSGGYDSGRPNHVMCHHTASPASWDGQKDVDYIAYGDEDAPLSNLYLARTGKVWVIAAGATNTNGTGKDPCGVTPNDSMNTHAIGIEAGNEGTGEVWPAAQQSAYTVLCKALCDHYGIPTGRVHAHHEWSPGRKIDPAGPSQWPAVNSSGSWNMDAFRGSVFNASPGPKPPVPTEDDPMRILQLFDTTGVPSFILSGYIATWIPTAEVFNAFVAAYQITPERADQGWMANCVVTGPLPPGTENMKVLGHIT